MIIKVIYMIAEYRLEFDILIDYYIDKLLLKYYYMSHYQHAYWIEYIVRLVDINNNTTFLSLFSEYYHPSLA